MRGFMKCMYVRYPAISRSEKTMDQDLLLHSFYALVSTRIAIRYSQHDRFKVSIDSTIYGSIAKPTQKTSGKALFFERGFTTHHCLRGL